MIKQYKYTISILLIVGFAFGCKTRKELKISSVTQDSESMLQADSVLQKVSENHYNFTNFKAKIKVKYDDNKDEKYTFTTLLKIKKDSIIYANITAFGLPIATIYITPDSVKFLNRRENNYFIEHYSYIETKLNTIIKFKDIQNLLTGNLVSLDTTKSHYLINEPNGYFISEIPQGKVQNTKIHPIKYWINELYKPGKTIINRVETNSIITFTNTEYKNVKEQLFPDKIEATFISPKDSIDILLNYNRIKNEKNSTFKFTIPKNYTRLK